MKTIDLRPPKYKFEVMQGSTLSFRLRVWNPRTPNQARTPMELRGKTARGQLRARGDTNAAADFVCTIEDTTDIDDPADPELIGWMTCEITAASMASVDPNRYEFDIELLDETGTVEIKPLRADVVVTGEATR